MKSQLKKPSIIKSPTNNKCIHQYSILFDYIIILAHQLYKNQSKCIIIQQMEFQFKVEQQSDSSQSPSKILPDSYVENEYRAVAQDSHSSQQAKILLQLQTKLKTQSLLLQYEEKRKNQRLKEIQYVYTNGFNNYLWEKNRKKGLSPMVIINRKDVLQIDQGLPDQLDQFKQAIRKIKMSQIFEIQQKPNQAFLRDFYNFYPKWTTHITDIITMQIQHAPKIQNAFEYESTFPSKVLSSLKLSSTIQMFCNQIFMKPLREIVTHNEQLCLDFNPIYDIWLDKIKNSADKGPYYNLYHFITRTQHQDIRHFKKIKSELAQLMGQSHNEAQKLLSEVVHFSQNKEAIMHLFAQIGSEQMNQAHINIKLAVLVWKKILANRKKIQSILIAFIDQILNSYYIFPKQVKYIMREYYRIAKKKFGQVKHQDVKSFFNKVIFSQLLFPQFMRLTQEQNGVDSNVKHFNIPIIALLSQKILFGQEFYQKAKHSYFNQLITHYAPTIHEFMLNFLDEIHDVQRLTNQKQINPMLISFQSVRYLYDNMRRKKVVPQLQSLQTKIQKTKSYLVGSSQFKAKDVYVIFIDTPGRNYQMVFKPRDKMKRIFIEFLLIIQKIPQQTPLPILLEQYKFTPSTTNNQSSVQIHANYLSLMLNQIDTKLLAMQISKDIQQAKTICQKIKIMLQKEHNYAQNLQKIYMNKLKQKQKFNATNSINQFINCLLGSPCGFRYAVSGGSVCEVQQGQMVSLGQCLIDIAEFYKKDIPGYDGLYHLLLQKICEEVQAQGIVEEQTMIASRNIVGKKLYEQLKIGTSSCAHDKKIHEQMVRHSFISLKLLDMPQYEQQQDLILQVCLPILEKLKIPKSADQLLDHLHQVTVGFQNIILVNGKASDITADVQIPMMILILIKSQIKNLQSLVHFIQKFCSEDINSSIMGQTLTLLRSVTLLIEQIGPKQLNLPNEQYQSLIEAQLLRKQAQNDRQYLIIDEDQLVEQQKSNNK